MKERKTSYFKAGILLWMLVMCLFMAPGANVQAARKVVTNPGTACKSGKYIYYAYEMSGVRMGIMRCDPSTGKKKKLTGYTYKGKGTNGFYSISVNGNYIYAVWDQALGTAGAEDYIYRISKNGKSRKKLGRGTQPVLAGDYIYYIETVKGDYEFQQRTGYICRMKKNGSKKERVAYNKEASKLYSDGKQVYYSTYRSSYVLYDLKGNIYQKSTMDVAEDQNGYDTAASTISSYYYYTTKNAAGRATQLYRQKTKGGKKNLIAKFDSGIVSWRVCGSYVMIKCKTGSYEKNNERLNVYCVSANGKKKKKLASWKPAE